MKKKYGLALEGGGAKGSYQIGAYLGLIEMGFEFEAVAGTSIGAINGAFIASGEVDKCINLWTNQSLKEPVRTESMAIMPEIKEDADFLTTLKELVKVMHKGTIPLTPLKELVYNGLDEKKIRNSKTKFGLVTVNVTDKRGEELFAADIPKGQLLDYIIASSYLPVFKMEPLNGKYFLDGGFYNKIPYSMIESLGLTPVIIRVNPKDYRDGKFPQNAIIIEPREKVNSTLNFDSEKADKLINLGFYDAMRVVKKLIGKDYYFEPITEHEALTIFKKHLFKYFEKNKSDYKYSSTYRIFFEEYLPKAASDLSLGSDYTVVDVLVSIVEESAKKNGVERFAVHNITDITDTMNVDDFLTTSFRQNVINKIKEFRNL